MFKDRAALKTKLALHSAETFEEQYLEYVDRVYWYLLLKVNDPQEAQDLTSQTFLKAYQAYPWLREKERFAPWIFKIARNLTIDHYRRSAKRKLAPIESSDQHAVHANDLLDGAILSERAQSIQAAIRALPKADQDLLSLRFVAQLTFKEIAAILKQKESTTKTAFYKLMASLKDHLEEK